MQNSSPHHMPVERSQSSQRHQTKSCTDALCQCVQPGASCWHISHHNGLRGNIRQIRQAEPVGSAAWGRARKFLHRLRSYPKSGDGAEKAGRMIFIFHSAKPEDLACTLCRNLCLSDTIIPAVSTNECFLLILRAAGLNSYACIPATGEALKKQNSLPILCH